MDFSVISTIKIVLYPRFYDDLFVVFALFVQMENCLRNDIFFIFLLFL